MIKNVSEQDWLVISMSDGEKIFNIRPGESIQIKSREQTIKDENFIPTEEIKGRFIKMQEDNIDEVIYKLKNFPSTFFALYVMTKHMVINCNLLLKNGKKYKCVDLAKELGVSRQTASFHIGKLKELNILAEIKTNIGNVLVVNPRYFVKGTKVPKEVVAIFDKQEKNS